MTTNKAIKSKCLICNILMFVVVSIIIPRDLMQSQPWLKFSFTLHQAIYAFLEAKASSLAIRSSTGGCVEKSLSIDELVNGLTMNICAVDGVASCKGTAFAPI